jgi:Bacterial TSP3 repeat
MIDYHSDDDGINDFRERGTDYRPPASREEWYGGCMEANSLGETYCREGAARYDPNNPGYYATNPRDPDTDSDGLLDGFEVRERYEYPRYGNRLRDRTSPTAWDTEGDGLSDGSEGLTYRTNARKYDTDGDCMSDGAEVRAGTDPTKRSNLRPLNCRRPKQLVRRVHVPQPVPAPLPQPR